MVTPTSGRALKVHKSETEIAVLQIQVANINEKIDDLKSDVKGIKSDVSAAMGETHSMIRTFSNESTRQHSELSKKVSALEKWKWMVMGGAAVAGALGFHVVSKIFGI
jgi:archaellum component FlaC